MVHSFHFHFKQLSIFVIQSTANIPVINQRLTTTNPNEIQISGVCGVVGTDSKMGVGIRIDFENNPSGIFYAGQILCGTVQLTLTEEKTVRAVYIRIHGYGYCEWSEGSGDKRVDYVGEEIYLDETSYLVGSREGSVKLTPGTHTYNIQCNLPKQLPTSVEGRIGYIRYTAHVTMDVPMGFNKDSKRRFTVLRPINLNKNPLLKKPVTSATTKMDCGTMFCCCVCIFTNPIEVSTQIPVAGYTPGQYINLQLHVTHKGSPKDYEFSVKLMKRIDYYAAGSRHNKDIQCITQKDESFRISNTTSVEVVRMNLRVPPVPPTDYESSKVVKVKYYLKILSSTGGCSGRRGNIIPIIIGTYPIYDVDATANPSAPILDQTTPQMLDSGLSDPNNELPTYEEAMDMVDGSGGGISDDNFRPSYPVFKRTTSYSSRN